VNQVLLSRIAALLTRLEFLPATVFSLLGIWLSSFISRDYLPCSFCLLIVFCGTARDSSQFSSQASRKVSLVVLDSLSLFLTGQEEKETSFFVLVHSSCPAHSSASIVFPVDLQGCVLHVVHNTGQPPLVLRCWYSF
jgi:hypothetical protein